MPANYFRPSVRFYPIRKRSKFFFFGFLGSNNLQILHQRFYQTNERPFVGSSGPHFSILLLKKIYKKTDKTVRQTRTHRLIFRINFSLTSSRIGSLDGGSSINVNNEFTDTRMCNYLINGFGKINTSNFCFCFPSNAEFVFSFPHPTGHRPQILYSHLQLQSTASPTARILFGERSTSSSRTSSSWWSTSTSATRRWNLSKKKN